MFCLTTDYFSSKTGVMILITQYTCISICLESSINMILMICVCFLLLFKIAYLHWRQVELGLCKNFLCSWLSLILFHLCRMPVNQTGVLILNALNLFITKII